MSYKRMLDELKATPEDQKPKVNWYDIYMKREKVFRSLFNHIDRNLTYIRMEMTASEERLMKKIEELEQKIDSLNE